MELLWRFLLGGLIVSAFALIGDLVRPKRFAGLFSSAPSVALTTLALTVAYDGPALASIESRSMMLSGFGLVLYAWIVSRILAMGRHAALGVSFAALTLWSAVAVLAGMLLTWSPP